MSITPAQADEIRSRVDRAVTAHRRAAAAVHAGMATQHERAAEYERAELETLLESITRTRRQQQDEAHPILTGPQARILGFIRDRGPITSRQLATQTYGSDLLTGNLKRPLEALLALRLIESAAPPHVSGKPTPVWRYCGPDSITIEIKD